MNFDDLTIVELLELTNKNIQYGLSVSQIGQLFNPIIKEDRIRKKLNKNGYKRVKDKDKTKTIFELQDVGQDVGQGVGQGVGHTKTSEVKSEVKRIKPKTEVIRKDDVGQCRANVGQLELVEGIEKDNFITLMKNFNTIMEMVEHYKNNSMIEKGDIIIHLPQEEDKSFKASLRVNKVVLEQFKVFCNNHKEFSQKDLLSMAMVEYINKHK
ncbi:MAG: hypothetical protein ACRC7N_20705 [Clostridium sp.]